MPFDPMVCLLYHRIVDLLGKGIDAGDAAELVLNEMPFENKSSRKLLESADDGETATLKDLLFFPDIRFQINIEPLLSAHHYDNAAKTELVARLKNKPPTVRLYFPGPRPSISITMPTWVVSGFVSRLKITRQLPKDVKRTVDRYVHPEHQDHVNVVLRNSAPEFTDNKACFLCVFFKNMPAGHVDFLSCLDLLLSVFDEFDENMTVKDMLASRETFYVNQLNRAHRQKKLLAASNMETLMSAGTRMTTVNPDLVREMLRHIHMILYMSGMSNHLTDSKTPEVNQ